MVMSFLTEASTEIGHWMPVGAMATPGPKIKPARSAILLVSRAPRACYVDRGWQGPWTGAGGFYASTRRSIASGPGTCGLVPGDASPSQHCAAENTPHRELMT